MLLTRNQAPLLGMVEVRLQVDRRRELVGGSRELRRLSALLRSGATLDLAGESPRSKGQHRTNESAAPVMPVPGDCDFGI